MSAKKKMTIKERLLAISVEEKIDFLSLGYGELIAIGKKYFDNRSAYSIYKKELKVQFGVDVDAMKFERKKDIREKKIQELDSCRNIIVLYSDFKSSTDRFCVAAKNQSGAVKEVWFGSSFGNFEQSAGERDAADKAIYLAGQVKKSRNLDTLKLVLYVDAEWLTTLRGKAFFLVGSAERHGVLLEMHWIPGKENPADKFTTDRKFGFCKSGENLDSIFVFSDES